MSSSDKLTAKEYDIMTDMIERFVESRKPNYNVYYQEDKKDEYGKNKPKCYVCDKVCAKTISQKHYSWQQERDINCGRCHEYICPEHTIEINYKTFYCGRC